VITPAQTTTTAAVTAMPAMLRQHLAGWAGLSPPTTSSGASAGPRLGAVRVVSHHGSTSDRV